MAAVPTMLREQRARQYRASQQGGGVGGGNFSKILQQMEAAQQKANLANEERYKEILAQYENLGEAGRTRIAQQETRQLATGQQGLISRGLGSTTITAGLERGVASDAELARQQLEESVATQKAGVMERRTDVGPDIGMYANLLQAASQGQAAAVPSQVPAGGPSAWQRTKAKGSIRESLGWGNTPMAQRGGGTAGRSRLAAGAGRALWPKKEPWQLPAGQVRF